MKRRIRRQNLTLRKKDEFGNDFATVLIKSIASLVETEKFINEQKETYILQHYKLYVITVFLCFSNFMKMIKIET